MQGQIRPRKFWVHLKPVPAPEGLLADPGNAAAARVDANNSSVDAEADALRDCMPLPADAEGALRCALRLYGAAAAGGGGGGHSGCAAVDGKGAGGPGQATTNVTDDPKGFLPRGLPLTPVPAWGHRGRPRAAGDGVRGGRPLREGTRAAPPCPPVRGARGRRGPGGGAPPAGGPRPCVDCEWE